MNTTSQTENPVDHLYVTKTLRADIVSALVTLIEHAKETYPHFESIRGQQDIANAEWAVTKIENL